MKTYPINEIFYSVQGEGFHTGIPALFIRFSGCNLTCPFCDTDFRASELLTLEQISSRLHQEAGACLPPLVILTGGEPTLFADKELCSYLRALFPTVAMETNGTRPVPEGVNWVTLSPKSDFLGEKARPVLTCCNELKIIYDGNNDPLLWSSRITADHYLLQPCDTGNNARNSEILNKLITILKANPSWRLSLQTHKYINVR